MRTAICATLTAGLGLWPAVAAAQTLSLGVGLPAALDPFQPGRTATGTGSLTMTAATSAWTLQVQDRGAGAGHLRAAATGCQGSSPQIDNPLRVAVTSSAINSAGTKTISATPTTVATGRSLLLTATTLTTTYSVDIPSTQVMLTGCAYSLTATYTLQ